MMIPPPLGKYTQYHRIFVDVPIEAGREVFEEIFTAVADAAFDAEPEERDGWDILVSAKTVPDATFRDATEEAVAALADPEMAAKVASVRAEMDCPDCNGTGRTGDSWVGESCANPHHQPAPRSDKPGDDITEMLRSHRSDANRDMLGDNDGEWS